MIAIILSLNRRKESSLEELDLPSLSYRYAALKVRGCDPGDRVLRGLHRGRHPPDGLLPSIRVKLISLEKYLPRKEVIQPHLPVRLPCYDFTPVMKPTVDAVLLAVKQTSSGEPHSHGVTGGVYKTRERIHRGILIRDY